MTAQSAASAAYIVAALLFILALAGLSRHDTARAGNTFGIAGMAIALVATLVLALTGGFNGLQLGLLIGAMAIGAAIGLFRAARVPMTGMPELIGQLREQEVDVDRIPRLADRVPLHSGAKHVEIARSDREPFVQKLW